jgi:hypothetical protein
MKATTFIFTVLVFMCVSVFGIEIPKEKLHTHAPPTLETIRQIQSEFLQLSQPLEFDLRKKDIPLGVNPFHSPSGMLYYFVLRGEVEQFRATYHPADIAIALRPFLREPDHDAEAHIILSALMKKSLAYDEIGFRSRANPGDWQKNGRAAADLTSSVTHSFISQWSTVSTTSHDFKKLQQYRIPPNELLSSTLKKKTKRGNGYSRLFSK